VAGLSLLEGPERDVVRTPAASAPEPDADASGPAPSAPPSSASAVATAAPTTAATTTTTTTAPSVPGPPVTTTTLAPRITAYASVGGRIAVRRTEGGIALDGEPAPSPGWGVRVHDDGPDRVRVQFESGGRRSEIRVDLEGAELVPRITEE
jgi:hypothetical protein